MVRYFRQERLGLGYIFIPHYRRLLFSILIVKLAQFTSIQIILILFISELMAIVILNSKPLKSRADNVSESMNEVVALSPDGFLATLPVPLKSLAELAAGQADVAWTTLASSPLAYYIIEPRLTCNP
jgi:hypothetical protein